MAHLHREMEPETEVRYERSGSGFVARQLDWLGGVLFRAAVYVGLFVLICVLALYACGAAGEAVRDKWDEISTTTTTQP